MYVYTIKNIFKFINWKQLHHALINVFKYKKWIIFLRWSNNNKVKHAMNSADS